MGLKVYIDVEKPGGKFVRIMKCKLIQTVGSHYWFTRGHAHVYRYIYIYIYTHIISVNRV